MLKHTKKHKMYQWRKNVRGEEKNSRKIHEKECNIFSLEKSALCLNVLVTRKGKLRELLRFISPPKKFLSDFCTHLSKHVLR